jgi:hypothetical protein
VAMVEPIRIDGLREFVRDVRKLDRDLPKAIRVALNVGSDLIVSDARPRVPHRSGRAARSLKASSTRTSARVSGGGNRAPHYPWLDFGGKVGRNRSVERPFLREGRFIYRSYFDRRDSGKLAEVLSDALVDVARQAGIEVT